MTCETQTRTTRPATIHLFTATALSATMIFMLLSNP